MRLRIRLSPLLLPALFPCVLRIPPAAAQAVGPEFRVNSYTTGNQRGPRLASGPGGSFVVVWQSYIQDGASYGIFGQRYDSAGAPLGAEFRVNTYTTGTQGGLGRPSVASDSSGNFVVVWESAQDGSYYGVFGQRYSSGGAVLGPEFQVNTYTTGNQDFPSVASDSGGNFVVVWHSVGVGGPIDGGIFGQRYGSAGTPLGTELQLNANPLFDSVVSYSGGNFVVVWRTSDGSGYGVSGQRYSGTGTPLGGEFRVNTYTSNDQFSPSVAADSGGTFVVVWTSSTQDGSDGVFGQRFDSAGASLGGEFRVNTYTTSNQNFPSVASDSAGNFIVVWQSFTQDGSGYGVFGQRFASTGAPLGVEFRVNTYATTNQDGPSVTGNSEGHFIVAWASAAQYGASYGVFGQRLCLRPLTSVTIGVAGSTTVCANSSGGTATVSDTGGGLTSHQWGYRTTPTTGMVMPLSGQTAAMYTISGVDFPSGGTYFLVCTTTPECGPAVSSNEVTVTVDVTPPAVTGPSALTMTQTLCM